MTIGMDHAVQTAHKRRTVGWWMGAALLLCAWLMLCGIVAQLFFAGSAILVDGSYWVWHLHFAQWLTYVSFAMVVAMVVATVVGRLPHGLTLRALLVVLLFVLQYLFIWVFAKIGLGALRGLHAVNALALFAVSLDLARRSWQHLGT